jgi:hypothetical protein
MKTVMRQIEVDEDVWDWLKSNAEPLEDSAFPDDVAKSNLAAILEQHGLKHVRSL